jgi:predicted aspartyl protease
MIQGVVNLRREATLTVVIGNSQGQRQVLDTVIDTGFNGSLTLPSAVIAALDLHWSGSDAVTLGDGSETLFDQYTATIIWDRQYREIEIANRRQSRCWAWLCCMAIDCRWTRSRVGL